jgi:hypothetical protein
MEFEVVTGGVSQKEERDECGEGGGRQDCRRDREKPPQRERLGTGRRGKRLRWLVQG